MLDISLTAKDHKHHMITAPLLNKQMANSTQRGEKIPQLFLFPTVTHNPQTAPVQGHIRGSLFLKVYTKQHAKMGQLLSDNKDTKYSKKTLVFLLIFSC